MIFTFFYQMHWVQVQIIKARKLQRFHFIVSPDNDTEKKSTRKKQESKSVDHKVNTFIAVNTKVNSQKLQNFHFHIYLASPDLDSKKTTEKRDSKSVDHKVNAWEEKTATASLFRQIVSHLVFVIITIVIIFQHRDINAFYMTQEVHNVFSGAEKEFKEVGFWQYGINTNCFSLFCRGRCKRGNPDFAEFLSRYAKAKTNLLFQSSRFTSRNGLN